MPKYPDFSKRVSLITGSVFEKYRAKMAAQGENLIKLHIGDTYLPPQFDLPISSSELGEMPAYNRYCNTFGLDSLRTVLAEKLKSDNDLQVVGDNILMTCGATNALSISMMSLIDSGDEVLILTPAWPFFFGMVNVAGGKTIEVPFYARLFHEPDLQIQDYLEQFLSKKTVAIYVNTPNNPSGKVLNRKQLLAIADFAKSHRLWLISDEAYDGLTFDDCPHVSVASLPGMFEQAITIFTFSKSFMFAGLRLGYAVADTSVIQNLNKMMVHQLYSPSTLAQKMMIEPVKTRERWQPDVREHYQDLRDLFVQQLEIDFPKPEGTYFIFFSAEKYLHNMDFEQLIEICLDSGVSVAPGDSFGKDFQTYIRLCFTGEPPQRLKLGIERLNSIFAA